MSLYVNQLVASRDIQITKLTEENKKLKIIVGYLMLKNSNAPRLINAELSAHLEMNPHELHQLTDQCISDFGTKAKPLNLR